MIQSYIQTAKLDTLSICLIQQQIGILARNTLYEFCPASFSTPRYSTVSVRGVEYDRLPEVPVNDTV